MMNGGGFRRGTIAALMIGAALPTMAWGQDTATPPGSGLPSGYQSSAPPFAQAVPLNDGDIIVTARRSDERLRDVPISITVFTQDQLTQRNITDLAQMALYTPSLQGNSRFGSGLSTFAIRGFVPDTATAPPVGIYFADVGALRGGSSVQAGDGAGPAGAFDLENIQILKGPQGTLFGRNTTGGAILLVPHRPTGRFEGYVEGSLGDYHLQRIQAVLNLPVTDGIRLRLGVDGQTRDGYLRNIGLGSPDLADIDYVNVRASLAIDITPDIENTTIATYLNSTTNGATQKTTACDDNKVVGSVASGGVPQGHLACLQLAREGGAGNIYTVSSSVPVTRSDIESFQVINTTIWKSSPALTVKNIVSYGELRNNVSQDAFGTAWLVPSLADQAAYKAYRDALPVTAATPASNVLVSPQGAVGRILSFSQQIDLIGRDVNHQSTFTEEFQLQGLAFDERLQWQAGLYYEKSAPVSGLVGSGGPNTLYCNSYEHVSGACFAAFQQPGFPPKGRLSENLVRISYEDMAAYAQATYRFSDRLRLTAGIRYTRDKSNSTAQYRQYIFSTTGIISGPTCQTVGVGAPSAPGCITTVNQTTEAPTWVIDLDYKPIDALLLYAKYSRGYRQGLANPQALLPNDRFEAEKLDVYELGAKAGWNGTIAGNFNIAGFYNNFLNQQLAVNYVSTGAVTGVPAGLTNVSVASGNKSEIYGFEADGRLTFAGFDLSGGYAYLHTRVTSVALATPPSGYAPTFPLRVGDPLLLTPKHKWNATLGYTFPVAETLGTIRLAGTYAFTGSTYSKITTLGLIDHFGIFNVNLDWRNIGGNPLDVSLFVTNLTKEKYFIHSSDNYASLGFVSKTPGEPQMWGVRLRYRFGD